MFYEDLVERFQQEGRQQQGGCLGALIGFLAFWLGSFLVGGVSESLPNWLGFLLLVLLFGVAFVGLFVMPVWTWWRTPKLSQIHCPHCGRELDPLRRERVIATRACPVCQYVFPSKLPPAMHKVQLDPARLPRVWLQGEVVTARPAEPLAAEPVDAMPLDDENPYRTPSPLASGSMTAQPHTVSGCLLVWWEALYGPLRTLLKSDAQLLAEPGLPVPKDIESERSQRFRRAYVLSRRRQAWTMLPLTMLWPLVAAILAWRAQFMFSERIEWFYFATPVLAWLVAVLLGLALLATLAARGPRWFKRWLAGGWGVIDADTDKETGYYGIRIRLTNVSQQHQLPRVRFQYRLAEPGDVLVRVVNHEDATALEMPLACEAANVWHHADVDLRQLVRQSEPAFFGDEMHLTSDPQAKLEAQDYEVVYRA